MHSNGIYKFRVHQKSNDAILYLQEHPLFFCDSLWLETHWTLFRPNVVLNLFDTYSNRVRQLLHAFAWPAPCDPVCGLLLMFGESADTFLKRRRYLIEHCPEGGSFQAMLNPFELDFTTE